MSSWVAPRLTPGHGRRQASKKPGGHADAVRPPDELGELGEVDGAAAVLVEHAQPPGRREIQRRFNVSVPGVLPAQLLSRGRGARPAALNRHHSVHLQLSRSHRPSSLAHMQETALLFDFVELIKTSKCLTGSSAGDRRARRAMASTATLCAPGTSYTTLTVNVDRGRTLRADRSLDRSPALLRPPLALRSTARRLRPPAIAAIRGAPVTSNHA